MFQEVDGRDVCFFAFYVQEYGDDCPPRNSRRVNIAYIDSVQFFEPPNLRTAVYHEALLAYMSYIKNMGFVALHLWVEPPINGDDYVFSTHPPSQKYLSQANLFSWYKKMLKKGMHRKIVHKFNTFSEEMKWSEDLIDNIPLFEGDFWLHVLEEKCKTIGTKIVIADLFTEIGKIMKKTKNGFLVIHLQQPLGLKVSQLKIKTINYLDRISNFNFCSSNSLSWT